MKFMNMKRFASTVMAGVLTLSLAVPAFAADTTPTGQVTITGTYQDIPIAVEVPTTGTAQINPYGLPVTITKSDDKTVDLVGQKVTTQPLSIKNQGTTKLDVNATLAVVPTGDVVIQGAALTDNEVGKEIDVVLEVAALDDAALALASDAEKLPDLLIDKFAAEETWAGAANLRAPNAVKGATSVANPAKSDQAMAVLGAVTPKSEGYTYAKNSIALFRLTGNVNAEPEKTESGNQVADPWKTTDGFSATIVFKFTPHADVAAKVTLDETTLSLDSSTNSDATLTATFNAGDSDLTVATWSWSTSDATVAKPAVSTSNSALVAYQGAGDATITVTATLSDGSTVTATCAVTCA